MLEPLHLPKQFLELAQLIGALAPVGQPEVGAQTGDDFNQLAHRIPQQIDVRGIMHIGFDHEGISADRQRGVGTFFYQGVPGSDHHLIDAIQDLRGEQAQVVFDRLQLVAVALVLRPAGMDCGFRANWTAVPRANWTPVPPQTGRLFQAKLDSRSEATRGGDAVYAVMGSSVNVG